MDSTENPYQAPGSDSLDARSEYHELYSPALSLRELWSISSTVLQFLLLVGCKIIHLPIGALDARKIPENLDEISEAQFDQPIANELEPTAKMLEQHGASHLMFFRPLVIGQSRNYGAVWLCLPENTLAVVYLLKVYVGGQVHTINRIVLETQLTDGRILITVAGRFDLHQSAKTVSKFIPYSKRDTVWRVHQQRRAAHSDAEIQFNDADEAKEFLLQNTRRDMRKQFDRGLFRPITTAKESRLRIAGAEIEQHLNSYKPSPKSRGQFFYWFLLCLAGAMVLGIMEMQLCATVLLYAGIVSFVVGVANWIIGLFKTVPK